MEATPTTPLPQVPLLLLLLLLPFTSQIGLRCQLWRSFFVHVDDRIGAECNEHMLHVKYISAPAGIDHL